MLAWKGIAKGCRQDTQVCGPRQSRCGRRHVECPVVPVAEWPGVTADIRMEVMKWAGKAEGDDEDMDASGSDSSDVGGETPASKSNKKTKTWPSTIANTHRQRLCSVVHTPHAPLGVQRIHVGIWGDMGHLRHTGGRLRSLGRFVPAVPCASRGGGAQPNPCHCFEDFSGRRNRCCSCEAGHRLDNEDTRGPVGPSPFRV